MIKVCPSFGDVLEQHTMLKNICPKLVAGEAPNTTGKMASYYIQNISLLIKPVES